ncbi:MAG: hypothetical protein HFF17_03995, partial [Oscillospiraceae bacterium]|nr:hypothetical protein [Oscillospiraceae bacterium]
LNVKVTGEGTDWWGQNIRKNVVKEFYHVDVRGSLVNMTDGYGRVAMRAEYDDWGDLTHSDSITVNGGFRQLYLLDNYTGHEYDQVLELYYAKYRFYDPAERRFVAEDPMKDGLNWFTYCGDSPTSRVDPLGLLKIYGVHMSDAISGKDITNTITSKETYDSVRTQFATLLREGVAERTKALGPNVSICGPVAFEPQPKN